MVEVHNLSAGYEGKPVLENISGSFAPGKIHVLLGRNGSGKSTFLKCLSGQLEPLAGQIKIQGKPLPELSRQERAQLVSRLPQSAQVPEISVERLVLHGRFPWLSWPRVYSKDDYKRARGALEQYGLLPLKDRYLEELSGGERQKAGLAQNMVQDAPVILLDEPGTWLDLSAQFELLEEMERQKREGRLVMMVLHDIAQALEYGDELHVFDQGQLLFSGSPEQLVNSGYLKRIFGLEAMAVQAGGKKRWLCWKEET